MSQRVADVCLRALAEVAPDRVGAASQGTMNNVLVGGDGWVFYETIGGGQGGRPGRAGMSGVHTNMTNTRDTPVEAFERAYPMRVRRYTIRRGAAAPGAFAGGDGIERELEALEPVTVSLITERRVERAVGTRRRRARARRGRTGCSPAATSHAPSASATRSPSTSRPATSSASSPPAAAPAARPTPAFRCALSPLEGAQVAPKRVGWS